METPTPSSWSAVSDATLSRLQARLDFLGYPTATLPERVAALVADRGSGPAVETALLGALDRARGDPLAYAQATLDRLARERTAAVAAATAQALAPPRNIQADSDRQLDAIIARMGNGNEQEFAGAYPALPYGHA
jgi:pimeloyl-ACP methyl ester carboxylesterase